MKKFHWVEKDYQNDSLNSLARNLTEYYTADLLLQEYEVYYSKTVVEDAECQPIGKLGISARAFDNGFDYSVLDTHIINSIVNYNLYFEKNTEERLIIPKELVGTFDCLVSLAAGNMIETAPIDTGLVGNNHYAIDISPTAIHKSMGLYKEEMVGFTQVDLFNISAVKTFLATCKGTSGFFVLSNCFFYIVSSLIYNVQLRLQMQNALLEVLAADKIVWHVSIYTADGTYYPCIKASELLNKQLDNRFYVLPWIK